MRRPHYAWAICLGSALMLFTVMGLGVNVFSIYQPYLISVNGFTNAQASMVVTIRSLFILFGMVSGTWMCQQLGLRRISCWAVLLLAGGCFLFGVSSSFILCCGAAMLTGLGYSWGGMIPISLLMDRWFRDRQTFALGISSVGSGLATILAPAPLTWLIEHVSLRAAFWCEGACALFLALAVWLIIRDSPESMGLPPYQVNGSAETAEGFSVRMRPRAMTDRRWHMVLFAVFLMGPASSLGLVNMGVLYASEGYSSGVVAALISIVGLSLMAAKPLYGQLVDRVGGRRSNYLVYAASLLSYVLCALAPTGSVPLAFLAAVVYGIGLPIGCMSLTVWAKDCLGDAGFSKGLKWCQTMFALGNLLFGTVPGLLADHFGSYLPAYFLFFGMMLSSMLLMSYVYAVTNAGTQGEI